MKRELKKYYKMLNDLDIDDTDLKTMRDNITKKYGVKKYCGNCNHELIKSDLREYTYLCLECDENYYEFEILVKDNL